MSKVTEVVSVHNLLKQHKKKTLKDRFQRVNIERGTLWQDTVALFKTSNFDLSKCPRVTFEDEE